MPYVKGDNWIICDMSGRKVLMSQSKKTWDGLRVADDEWEPKHPQLSIKGVPDRQAVYDSRPRPADTYAVPEYGTDSWILQSPNGSIYTVGVSNTGTFVVDDSSYQPFVAPVYLGNYLVGINNSKVLSVTASAVPGPPAWIMVSPNGTLYTVTVTGGVLTILEGV